MWGTLIIKLIAAKKTSGLTNLKRLIFGLATIVPISTIIVVIGKDAEGTDSTTAGGSRQQPSLKALSSTTLSTP